MKLFQCCHCAQRVFFENLHCESCGSGLGFVPAEMEMVAFSNDEAWNRLGPPGRAQRRCSNYSLEGICNWTVDADDPAPLCASCRTTEIIPALSNPVNRAYWSRLEQAKRRLFYTLLGLGLRAPSREEDPHDGMAFRFLEDAGQQTRVLTGHDAGTVTLNIAEADDAEREKTRTAMHEPYRSLLGHFRHESGHYYWDRLIAGTAWIDECRQLFGDERLDYTEALRSHYASPSAVWSDSYISAYASAHPWEDWAECWAHYLHMVDGLETAHAWGLHLDHAVPAGDPLAVCPVDPNAASIEPSLIEQWLPLSQFSNSMNRSLGLNDSYPFVVPPPVVSKLEFIHRVIGDAVRDR
ncbi:MAG: putative zinc-binding metallopeptidase [Burkholderiales bacterium]